MGLMVTTERQDGRVSQRFYNGEKVEIVNSLQNPPDDFDALAAVMSRVNHTIYYENRDLFLSVNVLYYRMTRTFLAEEEIKPFADFLVEARIIPVTMQRVGGSKKNNGGPRERFYFLRSKISEVEEKVRGFLASEKNGGTAV